MHALIPFDLFVEYQTRRRLSGAQAVRPDQPPTIAANGASAPASCASRQMPNGDHVQNNITVALPSVHMAGSDAHYDAHLEIGPHGLAIFLAPDAESPVLDVNATPEQLEIVVRGLQAALTSRSISNADLSRAAHTTPHHAPHVAETLIEPVT